MEILLWLAPPAVVTLVAMAWVSWLGREGRGEVDRDVAVRRLGEAMRRPMPDRAPAPRRPREPSTGLAVRPSRARPAAPPSGRPGRRGDDEVRRRAS
ncbi:hypothetical protein [Nocardioides ferulae]|uniref:hypothetical protein n=1 Tax=Nocardioides ferulae TaxID=2340821 RepID=UPI0013DE4124|nr:hypothetical protein [Nocardioides ferulae]